MSGKKIVVCSVVGLVVVSGVLLVRDIGKMNDTIDELKQPVKLEDYQPTEEFKPAYEAMSAQAVPTVVFEVPAAPEKPVQETEVKPETPAAAPVDAVKPVEAKVEPVVAKVEPPAVKVPPKGSFDLENTARVLKAIELAQSECGDWDEFLVMLAKQDYTGVPQDVVDAQKKLFPIMDRMRKLDAKYESETNSWAMMKCIGAGVRVVMREADLPSGIELAAGATPFGPLVAYNAITKKENRELVDRGIGVALESYNAGKKRQAEIKAELEQVRDAYIDFLTSFVPVRNKYVHEWEKMCLVKDQVYLQVNGGQYEQALASSAAAMKLYPNDRELVLLRALSLARVGADKAKITAVKTVDGKQISDVSQAKIGVVLDSPELRESAALVDAYINRWPDSSAPALVIRGLLECAAGEMKKAVVTLDQASMQYPQQAKKLADILEAYASRPYLEKTVEGKCLLRLHRCLYEGFGAFSPNLEKATVYESEGKYSEAREEIFRHFFRRGNQERFHELFSDMEFCEKNLAVGFKSLLLEHAFFDLDVSSASLWTKNSESVDVSLHNRTDLELTNVRVFLCVRFTDMYKTEYDVIKAGTMGKLKGGETVKLEGVKLDHPGKTFNEIASARAIVMTDEGICWIDPSSAKRVRALNSSRGDHKVDLPFTPAQYLASFGTDEKTLEGQAVGATVSVDKGLISSAIVVTLPRTFLLLDPVFSLGEFGVEGALDPAECRVSGQKIVLKFKRTPKDGESYDFCVYSDYLSLKVVLKCEGEAVKVDRVERLVAENVIKR